MISILRGLAASDFGTVTVRMPAGQHGPGHAEALQLSARDRVVPGREDGPEALFQPVQPRAETELLEKVRYLPVGGVRRADAQVRAQ